MRVDVPSRSFLTSACKSGTLMILEGGVGWKEDAVGGEGGRVVSLIVNADLSDEAGGEGDDEGTDGGCDGSEDWLAKGANHFAAAVGVRFSFDGADLALALASFSACFLASVTFFFSAFCCA